MELRVLLEVQDTFLAVAEELTVVMVHLQVVVQHGKVLMLQLTLAEVAEEINLIMEMPVLVVLE
jgi:hypothetical protein